MISIVVAGLCRSYLVAYFFFLWNFAWRERWFDAFAFYCRYFVSAFFGSRYYGMAYGFSSGRYRTDNDVIEGLTQPMKLLGVYFVIAFFAAQMFACFEYSHLDKCLAIMGADLLSSFEPAPLSALVLFILFTAFINLIMVSATSKWAFMSFIFIPMFAQMGILRISHSVLSVSVTVRRMLLLLSIFYMPLVLTYMRQYDKQITYGSLLKYTWSYSCRYSGCMDIVVYCLVFVEDTDGIVAGT